MHAPQEVRDQMASTATLSAPGLPSLNVGSSTSSRIRENSAAVRENSAAVVVGRVALPTPADADEFGDPRNLLRHAEFSADLLDPDPELLDLLAEDVSRVWN
jgi:hypothetical protein